MNRLDEDVKIEMTEAEKAFVAGFVSEKCRPHADIVEEKLERFVRSRQMSVFSTVGGYALAAAPQMKYIPASSPVAPNEEVKFVYSSDAEEAGRAWRAELTVPAEASVGTLLELAVSGLGVDAVPQGVFHLAGANLPLLDGKSAIPFEVFLAGIRDADVSLARADGTCEKGQLMFL